jgi:hypothetical protein
LKIAGSAIKDMAGNTNDEIQPTRVSGFTPDTTSSNLESWRLDMDAGTLKLRFDEPVDVSTLIFSGVSILSDAYDNADTSRVSLNVDSNAYTDSISGENVIQLTRTDINKIKSIPALATKQSNSFLKIAKSAIKDMAGTPWIHIMDPMQATGYIEDTTDPQLESWGLDMDTGILKLHFDEPVQSCQPEMITIQSSQNGIGNKYNLRPDSILQYNSTEINSTEINITLNKEDIDKIKIKYPLGTSKDNTFLFKLAGAVIDMNGNQTNLIIGKNANYVIPYPRSVIKFSLNMYSGFFMLELSEPINISSWKGHRGLYLESKSINGTHKLHLTNSQLITKENSKILTFKLSKEDFETIKYTPNFGSNKTNTYITVDDTAVMNDIKIKPISEGLQGSTTEESNFISVFEYNALKHFIFNNTNVSEINTTKIDKYRNNHYKKK